MNQVTTETQTVMSSLELLEIVNQSRKENGEPILRRNKFHEKIVDELEGEHYTKSVVQNLNNTVSEVFNLTRDQCTLVGMRESKAVRRSVLEKLKTVSTGNPLPNVAATMALAECAARVLNVSESGKIIMLRKAGEATGADTSMLPGYTVDAVPGNDGSSMQTYSLSHLLREFGFRIQAKEVNQRLERAGIISKQTRTGSKGSIKEFWNVTSKGLAYAKNLTSPQSPRETQPHYYRETFRDLLAVIGLEVAA